MSFRSPRLAWPAVVGLLLVACSSTTATTTSAPQAADIVVIMNEWRFSPDDASLADGDSAVIELRNVGSVLHEWALVDGPVLTEADMSDVEVLARLQVNTGGTARLELPPLEPGVYNVVCPIPGHIANGMVGTLTIEG